MNVHTKQIIKYDAPTIKKRLLDQLDSEIERLYSNCKYKKERDYYVLGDISGNTGETFKIYRTGRFKGHFTEWNGRQSGDIFALFAYHFNLDVRTQFKELLARLAEYLNIAPVTNKPLSDTEKQAIKVRQEQSRLQAIEAEKQKQLEKQAKTDKALELWNSGLCINHPKAQEYLLQARGLDIQFNMHVMRYLPEAWHSELKMNLPCIIALVRTTKGTPYIQSNGQPLINIQTGKPILEYAPLGIERHYLAPFLINGVDFIKMDWLQDDDPERHLKAHKEWFRVKGVSRRLMLGSKKGGVIKLNDSYKDKLVLCEGLFDALTLLFHGRELGILSDTETPNVYAFLGLNNLADITIPERYKEVYLLADNDSAGLNSIELLKNNHSLKGREDVKIEIFKTNSHKDLNELWLSKLKEKPERCDPNELRNINLEKR